MGWQGEALRLFLHPSATQHHAGHQLAPPRPQVPPGHFPRCPHNCHHTPLPNSGPYPRVVQSSTFHSSVPVPPPKHMPGIRHSSLPLALFPDIL